MRLYDYNFSVYFLHNKSIIKAEKWSLQDLNIAREVINAILAFAVVDWPGDQ